MPLKVTFELSDADLDYFRKALREAQRKASGRDEGAILAGARRVARETSREKLPEFVTEHLQALDALTRMLEDKTWRLEGAHRDRVLQALAYFAEPSDVIPDQIPGFGFLDDAIMIELVVQELRPELDAYQAFCRYRDEEQARLGVGSDERHRRLEERRRAMYARIDRRREQRDRRGGSFSIFG
jgi:uncharacterized membrane protein YkvA (DUF1232 family)